MEDADKFKELYEFARGEAESERGRYNRIDGKAANYFTVVTLLLGAYAFIGQRLLDTAVPPRGFCDWIFILVSVGVIGMLLRTFFLLFSVLRVAALKAPAIGESTLKFFSDQSLPTIYYAYSKQYFADTMINRATTDEKSARLTTAYYWIVASIVAIAIQFAALGLCEWVEITFTVRK